VRKKDDVRKLSLRRETVRRLGSLGPRELARVVGGTYENNESGGVDPEATGGPWEQWTNSQSLSTMSRFC